MIRKISIMEATDTPKVMDSKITKETKVMEEITTSNLTGRAVITSNKREIITIIIPRDIRTSTENILSMSRAISCMKRERVKFVRSRLGNRISNTV